MSGPRVPFLDLRLQYARLRGELDAAVARVAERQEFIGGSEVEAFEREMAEACEVPAAVACGSGSDALVLALLALGVGPGDEVLCPAYTFAATAGAVLRAGARPLFADVEAETWNASAATMRAALARAARPRVLLPVHLFGRAAPVEELLALARGCGLDLVEDAAQAVGARDAQGRAAGSRGRLGCLSFHPTKNLGAWGDGGMVLCGDAALAGTLRALQRDAGLHSRLDALQAAVLRVKRRHLEAWTVARRHNARLYAEAFAAEGAGTGAGPLEACALSLRTPLEPPPPARHVFHQYVVRVPAELRDALRAHLAERGVGSAVYYKTPLHRREAFAADGVGALPVAEAAARETLALPIQPELTREQIEHVVAQVAAFLRRA